MARAKALERAARLHADLNNIVRGWTIWMRPFVNAFVNAGFGNDKLMVDAAEGDSWIYKNKDHGA